MQSRPATWGRDFLFLISYITLAKALCRIINRIGEFAMSWYKVVIPQEQLYTLKLQDEFNEVMVANLGKSQYVAIFTEPNEVDDHYVYYFTPQAAEKCKALLLKYSAEPCDIPKSHINLVAGDSKAKSLLLKD